MKLSNHNASSWSDLSLIRSPSPLPHHDVTDHIEQILATFKEKASTFLGYRSLPPWAPDLNPIEPAWAARGQGRLLRPAAARSAEARRCMRGARGCPRCRHARPMPGGGYFRHAGYAGV